jgi:hypothetical protein
LEYATWCRIMSSEICSTIFTLLDSLIYHHG